MLAIFNKSLQSEQSPTLRRELLKVLGIIGAVDPHEYAKAMVDSNAKDVSSTKTETVSDDLPVMVPSAEDYYPYVAITALMRILTDSSLSSLHKMVVQAVMYIFRTLGLKCVPFLTHIMLPIMELIRTCEPGLRDFLFQQLGVLVSIVKHHIRKYLDEILAIVKEYWSEPALQSQMLFLVKRISHALKDEFKVYIPDLLPQVMAYIVMAYIVMALYSYGQMLAILTERSSNSAATQPQSTTDAQINVMISWIYCFF